MKKCSIKEINYSIIASGFSDDQLQSIFEACKMRRLAIVSQNKRAFREGTLVAFTSRITGLVYSGKVTKVAIKYISVMTSVGSYRVPANMLRAA